MNRLIDKTGSFSKAYTLILRQFFLSKFTEVSWSLLLYQHEQSRVVKIFILFILMSLKLVGPQWLGQWVTGKVNLGRFRK
jgi:hypothetical protein